MKFVDRSSFLSHNIALSFILIINITVVSIEEILAGAYGISIDSIDHEVGTYYAISRRNQYCF